MGGHRSLGRNRCYSAAMLCGSRPGRSKDNKAVLRQLLRRIPRFLYFSKTKNRQTISQSILENRPVHIFSKPISQPNSKPISKSISKSISQAISKPISKSISKATCKANSKGFLRGSHHGGVGTSHTLKKKAPKLAKLLLNQQHGF